MVLFSVVTFLLFGNNINSTAFPEYMNQRQIGIILLIVGIIFAALVTVLFVNENEHIGQIVQETGSCYLADGTCLHEERTYVPYIIGWGLSITVIFFGVYIAFLDKTQEQLFTHQREVSSALENAKREERIRDEFKAFLSAFSEDEQKILQAIHEQEGILQSTLRYRTGLSKTTLSLILKSLEERGFISRVPSKKSNKVFLKKGKIFSS